MATAALVPARGLGTVDLLRVTGAMASLGAAFIALGLAGPVLRGAATPFAPAAAWLVLALAAGQAAWALASLAGSTDRLARLVGATSLVLSAGWALTTLVQDRPGQVSALLAGALSAAGGLGALLATALRGGRGDRDGARVPPAWVQAGVLLVVAVAVAAAVTPALAAGPAGVGAMDHMAGMHL